MNSSWSLKCGCLVETRHCLSLGELKIHVEIGCWSLAPSLSGKFIFFGLIPLKSVARVLFDFIRARLWALEIIQCEDAAVSPLFSAERGRFYPCYAEGQPH